MAKIDLTKQARAPQNPGQVLKVSAVTSSLTGLYEWTTGVDSDSQTRSNATISGSHTALSASLSSRLTIEEAESNRSDATISGSHTALSASLSARLALEEAESVRSDQTISGSHAAFSQSNHQRIEQVELRLGKGIGGSGYGLVFGITGSLARVSASHATRLDALKDDSGSFSTRVQTLETQGDSSISAGTVNLFSGSAISTGSFGSLVLSGRHFTSESLVQSLSFDDSTNSLAIEGGGQVDLSPLAGGGGGGSGMPITASDEGVDLSKAVRTFDFTGNAMTATNVGNEVTVNVTALTSSADIASDISGSFTALSASLSGSSEMLSYTLL